jgi:hypothetical protein
MKYPLTLCALVAGAFSASAEPKQYTPKPALILLHRVPAGPAPVAIAPVADVAPVYNGESTRMFATKVQPILNNLCANCHAKVDYAGAFKMTRMDEGFANPQATEKNQRAALKQLNSENPGQSPLLLKTLTAHGPMKEAPLKLRQLPPFKMLEYWAYWAMAPQGAMGPKPIPVAPPAPMGNSPFAAGAANTEGLSPFAAKETKTSNEPPPAIVPVGETVAHLTNGTKSDSPLPLPAAIAEPFKPMGIPATPPLDPNDPFDPAAFNKYAHPGRR